MKLLFSISDDSNFWISVNNRWNSIIVDVRVFAGKVLDSEDSFFFGFVGKHGASDDITDSVNVGDVCLEGIVNDNSSFLVHFNSSSTEV